MVPKWRKNGVSVCDTHTYKLPVSFSSLKRIFILGKNVISFDLVIVCILIVTLGYETWTLKKCQISRKNVFNTGWQIAWDVKIYYCINQFRVNLSVNKLIVFYALKIEFCLAEPNHCNNWSVNVKLSKIFAFFVRSLALQHFFLVFVLSMSWQRLRSPTRIVCPTIYSWLKKYAFYTSNTAKQ